MKPYLKLVMAGWLIKWAMDSLFQDAIGLDAYLAIAKNAWASPWLTVPMAILALVWAFREISENKTPFIQAHFLIKNTLSVSDGVDAYEVAEVMAALRVHTDVEIDPQEGGSHE